jgi:hypothetical protein
MLTHVTELLTTLSACGVSLGLKPDGGLIATGDPAAISRHRDAIRQHKPELLAILTTKAGGTESAPVQMWSAATVGREVDPLNPTNDPELSRLLALPLGERLVALVQAGYHMGFENGRLARVVRLADIEAEPEALGEDQHQGDADAGRVACVDCRYFERDRIGNGSGIGKSAVLDNPPGGLLYPKIERRCSRFEAITADEVKP